MAATEMLSPEAAPIVALRGIAKTYGATRANDEIDLDIAAGEVIGLVGGNGAGKSTLMKVLCGVVQATSGEVLLDGQSVAQLHDATAAQAHGIRMVHQELSPKISSSRRPRPQACVPAGAAPTAPVLRSRCRRSFPARASTPMHVSET